MIRHETKLLGILRAARVAVVGLPFMMSMGAMAQTPAAGGEATSERVVVTGSYIPTAEEVTASPLDTVTTQDIARSGQQDVLTTLQKRNPDFVGAGNIGQTNANISSGATLGGATVTIRGLPTLVLYEGRRIADSAAIAVGGATFTDVNLFPVGLVSRIEVLKDGASALYGSEAVGGVINIFTKDNFSGAEIGLRYGTTLDGAVAERRIYVEAGIGNETTQVTAGSQYYEIDPLFERQRDYSRQPFQGLTTTYGGVGRDNQHNGTKYYLLNGVDPRNPLSGGGLNSPFDAGVVAGSIAPPAPGAANQGQYALLPQAYTQVSQGEITNYDLSLIPNSTLDQSRSNEIVSFSHQIFGKQLEMFGNFMYTNEHSESFLNAQPLSNGTGVIILGSTRVNPNFDPSMAISAANPTLIPETRGAPAQFNPFNLSIDSNTLSGDYRLFANNRYQTNPRDFIQDSNFYRFLGGLRSQINQDWNFETAFYYSKYAISFVNRNLVNANQLNAMIAGTALDASGAPIPALDFFARNPIGNNPGQVTADQFNTIFGSNFRDLDSFQRVVDARVTGFPFSLPGGKVGVSFGGEFRVEGFKVQDSPEIFVGSVPIQQIDVRRDIESAYAEASIPIVSSEMKIPFVYNLELDLAGRYDHYEGVSEDAKVPKVTLRYQPIPDLTVRATYSNSFVAPTLYQLFGPSSTGFSAEVDLDGQSQDQAQVKTGSNASLVPSTAESYTAGIVYSPKFVPGLTITADYFRTLQQEIVGTLGGATILNSVENLGPASPYAGLVAFNNYPGSPGARPVTAAGQLNGNLASVFYLDLNQNIGAARIEGFDLSAHYNWDLKRFGQLEFGLNAVVFTKYDLRTTPQSPYYNILGLTFDEFSGGNGGGAQPDYKLTALTEYRYGGLTVSTNANYIPSLKNAVGADPEHDNQSLYDDVVDYYTIDGRLSYEFRYKTPEAPVADAKDAKDSKAVAGAAAMDWREKVLNGLTVAVGCNNIFDRQPPLVIGSNSATNLSIYDPFGRFLYFEVSKKF